MNAANAVIVFAKYPQAGQVKTRLIGAIQASDAACVHMLCFCVVWRILTDVAAARRILAISPDATAGSFPALLGGVPADGIWPQGEGTLGERLHRAAARAFAEGAERVVLLGCDTPTLTAAEIQTAFDALATKDVVLGPALDGGYYLLGLRRPPGEGPSRNARQAPPTTGETPVPQQGVPQHQDPQHQDPQHGESLSESNASAWPALFAEIDWGSERVADQTRARARQAGLTCVELPVQRDLDRWEDVVALAGELPSDRPHLASLRALLNELVSTRENEAG